MNKITPFQKKVYVAAVRIPRGFVSTYAEIALAIGKKKAARAVGNALNRNPYAPEVPCHRIVKSNGELGGFAGGSKAKIRMLEKENVQVKNGKVVDFQEKVYRLK